MKNVTIIEDDASLREVLNMIFDADHYNLTLLADGRDVMSNKIERPDLFIIDRYLSGSDGLDLCRYIKATSKYSAIPVLIISAAPDIELMARAAGAEAVLAKPFRIRTIREVVNRALAGKYRFGC